MAVPLDVRELLKKDKKLPALVSLRKRSILDLARKLLSLHSCSIKISGFSSRMESSLDFAGLKLFADTLNDRIFCDSILIPWIKSKIDLAMKRKKSLLVRESEIV